MKKTIAIMMLMFWAVLVTPLSAKGITINFSNITVEEALEQLKDKEGLSFLFKTNDVDIKQRINVSFTEASIEDVMKKIFEKQNINCEIDGNLVKITKRSTNSPKQALGTLQSVKGTITDENGEPLIGVNIKVVGSNLGTISDIDGNFEIAVSPKSKIELSYVGFENLIINANVNKSMRIAMRESANDLDEVVVVGYGTTRKSDLTGAVSSVKTSDLPISSNTSISHMLSGKAAGVTIKQTSAQPGGGIEMLIRGAASTGAGNEPLYIIDGFPVSGSSVEPSTDNRYSDFGSRNPLNSINPNDVESIEILKDASSTAIYGARAANGVVIITTKKGKEGKASVNYSGSYGVQQISNRIEMMNATEYMQEANHYGKEKWLFDNEVYPYGNTDPNTITPKYINQYTDKEIANAGKGTDWYGLITQDGMIHQENISVSGGSETLKFMTSFNYFDQIGVVKNSGFTRYTGRVNIEQKLSKIFSYGINATQSYIKSTNVPLGTADFENSGLINSALSYDPTIAVKDKKGEYVISPLMSNVPNPVSMLEITDYTQSKRLLVSAFVQANILKNLVAKVNIGMDDQSGNRNSYVPKSTLYGKQEGGKASKSYANQIDRLIETTLNYNVSIAKKHKLNILAGYSYQDFSNETLAASNSQFFTDAFLFNSLMTGESKRPTVSSGKSRNVLLSYFGRINYNFNDKYLLTFTARVDGSNKFGINNRYGFFPSGAFAWRINQEDFLKEVKTISDLKLRVSMGQTGNSNIGNNAFEYYTAAWKDYVFGDAINIGTSKYQLANPDLKWETTTEINLGLDFGLFDQRLSGSFEFFTKEVKDLLGYKTQKSFMEVSTVAANIGKTQSSGIELSLKSRNFTGAFKWDTEFNLTRYVDRWKERNPELNINPWQKNDDPIRAIYGYIDDGILGIGETAPASMPLLKPGQFKVKDLNGYRRDEFGNLLTNANGDVEYMGTPDGLIDEADITLLGVNDPGFSIGLGNTFEYKGFDLNIFFYGMFDRLVNNETRGKYSIPEIRRIANGQNFMLEVKDRWSSENPNSKLPSGFTTTYPQPAAYLWEDGWFIRCKNITLGYTLPHNWINKVCNKARLYADFGNPFVITQYTGNDPETDFKAGYPNQRSFMIGLDVTF